MERIFLWGTGNTAIEVMQHCRSIDCYNVLGFIDNDKDKVGTIFCDKDVYSPEILRSISFDRIVVLSDYQYEIQNQIIC